MLYSDNGVTHNYNAKDNTKSNWRFGVLLISIVVLGLDYVRTCIFMCKNSLRIFLFICLDNRLAIVIVITHISWFLFVSSASPVSGRQVLYKVALFYS